MLRRILEDFPSSSVSCRERSQCFGRQVLAGRINFNGRQQGIFCALWALFDLIDSLYYGSRQGCGEWFDMRDLGQVLAHVHDAEIEISEGPEPLQPAGSLRRSSCRSTLGARD